jgi:hypothetical protein
MRPEVAALAQLGPLPAESEASVEFLRQLEQSYRAIARPVSDEEARALVMMFGNDGCFGLASSLMHLIETAPGWPLKDCLTNTHNEWVMELRRRAIRGGIVL